MLWLNMQDVGALLILSMATAAISLTVTKSKLFEGFRGRLEGSGKLAELVSCPYCFSHWVSFIFVAFYLPRPIVMWFVLDLIVSAMSIVALASLMIYVLLALSRLSHDQRQEEDEDEDD